MPSKNAGTTIQSHLDFVLETLKIHREDDSIIQCPSDHLHDIPNNTDELLELADKKLHVFPFKEVKSCWFRLYTDASIAKAIKLISSHLTDLERDLQWIQESVRILDMALIMAGGLGREDVIHDILDRLQKLWRQSERSEHSRDAKRRKLNPSIDNLLPSEEYSIPNLTFPVSRLQEPSLEDFQDHINVIKKPVILTNILHHWPALEIWKDVAYWTDQTIGGARLVPVELGRSYVDDGWGQNLMRFRDFMHEHIVKPPDSTTQTGYLAQHDLLSQIPSLRTAIATPDYCYLDAPPPDPSTPVALKTASTNKTSHPSLLPSNDYHMTADGEDNEDVKSNIWFGPPWTISPLHHDPYHNILCQVVGKKYIRLYSPRYSSQLFPRSSQEPAPHLQATAEATAGNMESEKKSRTTIDMSNTSLIDLATIETSPHEDWDAVYPGFSDIPYFECILSAGEALYIPIGWWHYVRSCSVGISVSYWWRNDQTLSADEAGVPRQ